MPRATIKNFSREPAQVFFDPTHHRWLAVKSITMLGMVCLLGLLALVAVRVMSGPELGRFSLVPPENRTVLNTEGFNSGNEVERREPGIAPGFFFLEALGGVAEAILDLLVTPASAGEYDEPAREPEVVAFYVNWEDASRASLREHGRSIDVLVPEWVQLANPSGELDLSDDRRTEEAIELIETLDVGTRILPLFTNYFDHAWQIDWLRQVLHDPKTRYDVVNTLLDYVESNEFAGITLGLQGLQSEDSEDYFDFVHDLSEAFHENGLQVYQTLAMQDRTLDALRLSALVDAIIVLGDGEGWDKNEPGPLASQDWYESAIERRASEIPADKLIVGVSNLARDWSPAGVETYALQEAFSRARESGADIRLDPSSLNATFEYTDTIGMIHSVWMLDAVTAFNHWQAARRLSPKGVALWRLGSEDPSVWPLLDNPLEARPESILDINFSHQLERYGQGEVLRLSGSPHNGHRLIEQGPDGRIVAERIDDLPHGFQITQWGAATEKVLALTFDDGPDPVFTPQILDVLKAHGVPATFFMVGNQMLRHPEIVHRVMDEGHEVGSHTYSHANISKIGEDLLRLELNATQRVFESLTGRNLVMFRAPYATDTNPTTVEELRPLRAITDMGYVAVNMNIDSRDWHEPTAERIVADTIAGARSGAGNIVLLHDSGGDRRFTVEALPEIIERARAEGFRFVTVSSLIGKTRDEVMPRVDNPPVLHMLQATGFGTIREIGKFFALAFAAAITLGIARSVLLITLSFVRQRRERASALVRRLRKLPPPPKLSVGVVVPGYNEEKVIVQTVRSLLASTLPDLQVLVVDDGSTDDTYRLCRTTFKDEKRVRVVTKKNGGKAAALNFGIRRLKTDIIIGIDADTILMPDAIERLVEHFSDPKVAAVCGNAKVGNRVNLLTRWQALEYITAQNLDRRAFEHLNCIPVVPGAIGAWRREPVIAVGGFTADTLAEDADLTMRLLRQGHVVTYQELAIALTEAPETIRQFNKQRFRWMYGTLQVAFKHLGAMWLTDSKSVGLVALPNTLLFQILFPLLAPVADLGAIIAIGGLTWDFLTNSRSMPVGEAMFMLGVFFAFVAVDFIAAAISFYHEKREDWLLLIWVVPQRFFYRQLIYIVAIRAVLSAFKGSPVGWGSLKRTAHVKQPGLLRAPASPRPAMAASISAAPSVSERVR